MRFKYILHTNAGEIDVEAQDLATIVSKGQCTRWSPPHPPHGWQMTRCTSWCGDYESGRGPFDGNRWVVA